MSLQAALQGYTLGPAYAAGLENSLGQIAPGFFADCIILPEAPARIPTHELHRLSPSAVMVAGEWVLESE
jgi:predicted amidohydrolase YtcJ